MWVFLFFQVVKSGWIHSVTILKFQILFLGCGGPDVAVLQDSGGIRGSVSISSSVRLQFSSLPLLLCRRSASASGVGRSTPLAPVPWRRPHLSPSAADAEAVSMATPAAASSPLRRGLSSPGFRGNPTTAEEGRRRRHPLLLSTDYPGPPSVPRSPSSGPQYVSLQRALTFIQLIYSGLT